LRRTLLLCDGSLWHGRLPLEVLVCSSPDLRNDPRWDVVLVIRLEALNEVLHVHQKFDHKAPLRMCTCANTSRFTQIDALAIDVSCAGTSKGTEYSAAEHRVLDTKVDTFEHHNWQLQHVKIRRLLMFMVSDFKCLTY
jgi:hypothetical protein